MTKLRPDQPVILIEENDHFEIRPVASELERTHTIVEVGSDYVLFRDSTEQIEVMVPAYSIKAIIVAKDLQAVR